MPNLLPEHFGPEKRSNSDSNIEKPSRPEFIGNIIALADRPNLSTPKVKHEIGQAYNYDEEVQKIKEYLMGKEYFEVSEQDERLYNTNLYCLADAAQQMGFYYAGDSKYFKKTQAKEKEGIRVFIIAEGAPQNDRHDEIIDELRTKHYTHVALELPQEEQEKIDKYLDNGDLSLIEDLEEGHIDIIMAARRLGIKVKAVEAAEDVVKDWLSKKPHLRKYTPEVVAAALFKERNTYVAEQLREILKDQKAQVLVQRGDFHTGTLCNILNKLGEHK